MPSLQESDLSDWMARANQLLWKETDVFGQVFVESGTYYGDTVEMARHVVPTVHTIEISKDLWQRATERFAQAPNVTCHHGDSPSVLTTLLPTLGTVPVMFWLDAHWSKGTTSFHSKHVPLLDELRIICQNAQGPCLLMIDDVRLFGGRADGIDWSGVTEAEIDAVVASRVLSKWKAPSPLSQTDRLIVVLQSL